MGGKWKYAERDLQQSDGTKAKAEVGKRKSLKGVRAERGGEWHCDLPRCSYRMASDSR